MDTLREWGGRGLHTGLSTLSGFQKFILRGNVVDLAIGVVIGAAFSSVVSGAVTDLLQPLLGMFVSTGSFDNFQPSLNGHPFLVGKFIGSLITFLLTAAVLYFFVVKPVAAFQDRFERLRPKKEEAPTTRECPFCLSTVNIKATRCAYCTAQLPPADQPAPAGAS